MDDTTKVETVEKDEHGDVIQQEKILIHGTSNRNLAPGVAPGYASGHKKICICKFCIAWGQILCNKMPRA
ncbi:hypothetical protein T10_12700 [Trichinella papuae]|uniref:Uncharacterized protein n=1 Tax=Trichinella papuae TaxID=268474 RepID=A0A0V1M0D8_9BILA|nr:hypothetical protein T10_12700 [Trichinella papuae]